MTMTKKEKKYKVDYHKGQHLSALQKQKERAQIFEEIKKELKQFEIEIADKTKFKLEPIRYIQDQHRELAVNKYKLPEALSFAKHTDMLEQDFTKVVMLVGQYLGIAFDEDAEITEEQFCVYAETPEQVERFELCKNFIEAQKKMFQFNYGNGYKPYLARELTTGISHKKWLEVDGSTGDIRPKPSFVMNGILF